MNEKEKFIQLFQRYLDNTISEEDRQTLMQWIDKGKHDDWIKDKLGELWQGDIGEADMNEARAKQILRQILSREENETGSLAAGHRIERRKSRRQLWKTMTVAAIVLVLVTAGSIFVRESLPVRKSTGQEETAQQPVVYKGKQYVKLPDGSTVMLNEGSELSYEGTFARENREVRLSGEGYFDIQRDTSKPFVVRTGKVATTVLGTAFNIKAYPGEKEIEVTVTRGKVQVGDDKQTYGIITPDQRITVSTVSYQHTRTRVDAEAAISWKEQYLVLDDLTLEDAAARIAEKYDVTIEIADANLKKCRITATFLHGEDLEHVLTVISNVLQASYTIGENGKIIVEGEGCSF